MEDKFTLFEKVKYEPWAVFYWGNESHGLTKQEVIDFVNYEHFDFNEEEFDIPEPSLFYIHKREGDDELISDEEFPWFECRANDEGAIACYGVKLDV